MSKKKYKVVRDSDEKKGKGWLFEENEICHGTEVRKIPTGDYTLVGIEKIFVIERKASTGELAKNFFEARFEREFERLEEFKHPFVICEFPFNDILSFPKRSGIPFSQWRKLKMTPNLFMKFWSEYETKYKTKFIFAGDRAEEAAKVLFKRMMEKYL